MLHYMKEDHRSYRRNFCSSEKKAWKNSDMHGIPRTLDLCDTGASSALQIEATSQLAAGRWIGSL